MNILINILFPLLFSLQIIQATIISESCQHRYFIVVDGGSSGTRLNLFKFDMYEKYPKINKTFIFKSKVALSSFSNNRENWNLMRIMVINLTDSALSVIPERCVKETPFYVRVTAGIRQIERRMGSRILNNLRNIMLKSNFYFDNNFIDILGTAEEGEFAWISINFLLERFKENGMEPMTTVGVLDLGGGSTQIAFATDNIDLIKESKKIQIFGQNYYLYARGYDFMGINEARLKYFNAQNCCLSECENNTVRSQCLHPKAITTFKVGNRTVIIGGKFVRDRKRFCYCFGKGLSFIKTVNPIRKYFGTKTFVAFSAYYYILNGAEEILRPNTKGILEANIRDIIIRAMELCETPTRYMNSKPFSHFLCMDLSYIVALLHNGYGFEWYDELISSLKIKNINLSWALGFAISKF